MRTALDIDDPIPREVKAIHESEGRPMGAVVSELLADALARRCTPRARPAFRWTGGSGLSRGNDLGDPPYAGLVHGAIEIQPGFFKIARISKTPAQDVRELGLDDDDARYLGMDAYMPGSPVLDDEYRTRFYTRTSYWRVARFYPRHPARAIEILRYDLRNEAPRRRLYSNLPKSYGRPPYAQTQRFSTWSSLRTWLFHLCPGHVVVWYALAMLSAPLLAMFEKSRFRRVLILYGPRWPLLSPGLASFVWHRWRTAAKLPAICGCSTSSRM